MHGSVFGLTELSTRSYTKRKMGINPVRSELPSLARPTLCTREIDQLC